MESRINMNLRRISQGFLSLLHLWKRILFSSFYGLKSRCCKNESFHVLFLSSYLRKYITLIIELSFLHSAIKNLRRKPSLRMDKPNLRMNLQWKVDKSGRYAWPFIFFYCPSIFIFASVCKQSLVLLIFVFGGELPLTCFYIATDVEKQISDIKMNWIRS